MLLILMKLLALMKTVLAAFLSFIFKPIFFVLKFVFLKIFAKAYLVYFSFARKIGWNRLRENFFAFVFSRKTVHILLAILVVVVSISGLMSQRLNAKSLNDNVGKTMIASLVVSEFTASEDDGLIEELAGNNVLAPNTDFGYLDNSSVAVGKMKITTSTEEIDGGFLADLRGQNDEMVVKPELATTAKSKKTRKTTIEYVVQPGDVIGLIADSFDISVNTILWENSLTAYSLIRPGDKLIILPATGITYKVGKGETLGAIASKYDVSAEEILVANSLPEDSKLSVGEKLFLPGAQKIYVAAPVAKVVYNYSPVQVIKDLLKPSPEAVVSSRMLWPTVGHILTQYFSWRHGGLDIANKQGTPVYAADDGVIIDAGWSTSGYGNKIDIDHGGGKVTRYGHAVKLLVKKGDVVKKGDIIMLMGTTGHSTGPHLHFEVRINGKVQNPLSYIR
jgi:murein DD-endopeptidase MepM/ murein hydrolase activator NlpD